MGLGRGKDWGLGMGERFGIGKGEYWGGGRIGEEEVLGIWEGGKIVNW